MRSTQHVFISYSHDAAELAEYRALLTLAYAQTRLQHELAFAAEEARGSLRFRFLGLFAALCLGLEAITSKTVRNILAHVDTSVSSDLFVDTSSSVALASMRPWYESPLPLLSEIRRTIRLLLFMLERRVRMLLRMLEWPDFVGDLDRAQLFWCAIHGEHPRRQFAASARSAMMTGVAPA